VEDDDAADDRGEVAATEVSAITSTASLIWRLRAEA
jgi:hypothetical protein